MALRREAARLLALAIVIGAATWTLARWGGFAETRTALEAERSPTPDDERAARGPAGEEPEAPPGTLRWIVAGGGSVPELNQVQLEQDLALAREIFAPHGPGQLFYAGGPGSRAVQVLREASPDDPEAALRARLAPLFDPRGGRDTSYRDTSLSARRAASAETLLSTMRDAILEGDAPLTVYLAGHGVGGDEPRQSRFLTWGPGDLSVEVLSETLDDIPGHRPLRLVMTACYAGGFAEMAFEGGDLEAGPAPTDRCGFFATSWDRAAAGCDPNPDRGAQEGYGIHFLHALRGEDRNGDDARAAIDLDGDGTISLLEAHSRARIESSSLDVPVTTSEAFLRAAVSEDTAEEDGPAEDDAPEDDAPEDHSGTHDAPPISDSFLEEQAVARRLARRLGTDGPQDVSDRLDRIHQELRGHAEELDRIDEEIDFAAEALRGELLHRWPVVDDPWHPDFAATMAAHHGAITDFLDRSDLAARLTAFEVERERTAEVHDELLLRAAPLERLERAHETLRLAERLRARGGPLWQRYEAFLACERGAP